MFLALSLLFAAVCLVPGSAKIRLVQAAPVGPPRTTGSPGAATSSSGPPNWPPPRAP